MVKFSLYLYSVFLVLFFSAVASSLGCCVSPDLNVCSASTQDDYCSAVGGKFYASNPDCSGISTCDSGCCILGTASSKMIYGKCSSETQRLGFPSINFIKTTQDCNTFITSQDSGACITTNTYGRKTCVYSSKTQCLGQFFQGTFCSDVNESPCNKTNITVCFGNDVYYKDSCGNRDALKASCDYKTGNICSVIPENGQDVAKCKDATCIDNFDFSKYALSSLYANPPKYNGPVIRKQGEVWCVTDWNVPFAAGNLQQDPSANTASSLAGLRFYSRSCIDGKIITEPCDDSKEGYCSGSSWWSDNSSSSGTGGYCTVNIWRDCLDATDESECDPANCFWYNPQIGLDVSKCLPKIPGGGVASSTSRSSICDQGTYQNSLKYDAQNAILYLNVAAVPNAMSDKRISFMPFNPVIAPYLEYRCEQVADCNNKKNWLGVSTDTTKNQIVYMTKAEINSELKKIVVGKDGTPISLKYLSDRSGINLDSYSTLPVYYPNQAPDNFTYSCVSWKPPMSGVCSECDNDGTVCTKYKCESIGKNCQYFDQGGKNGGGTCMIKTDFTPPAISINCPISSSIKAQQPINISVNTSESSYCRFNVDYSGQNYDTMQFDLGATWGLNHATILAVPGMNKIMSGNVTQYPLLTKSGNYSVYVRCIDAAGNGDSTPSEICSFIVPKTPDNNPPIILQYDPISGSPIIYNTTEKQVNILVNEMSECRWDKRDVDYDSMSNSFDCGKELLFSNDISGYKCTSTMTNITKNIGNTTKFYIRCKDQPWMLSKTDIGAKMISEGFTQQDVDNVVGGLYTRDQIVSAMTSEGYEQSNIDSFLSMLDNLENSEYHRNADQSSFVYSLAASSKFSITEISPINKLVVGKDFSDWTLIAKTAGGGYSGESTCRWRLNYKNQTGAFAEFMNTGGTTHTQTITQVSDGDYMLDVKCIDNAGNVANASSVLKIRYDLENPTVQRVYNDKGYMKIVTTEKSVCKFTNSFSLGFGCGFDFNDGNLTSMTTIDSLSHTANWKRGVSYFIKCKDFYGNINPGCSIVSIGV